MPAFVLGTKNTAMHKTEQNPCLFKAYLLEGGKGCRVSRGHHVLRRKIGMQRMERSGQDGGGFVMCHFIEAIREDIIHTVTFQG